MGRLMVFPPLAAAAWAELRSLRRAVRTWVFFGLGLAVAFTAYGYYSYLRDAVAFNPDAGFMSPRYTSAYFTIYLLWFFMAAVVFLAFDGRGRDEREGDCRGRRFATGLQPGPAGRPARRGGVGRHRPIVGRSDPDPGSRVRRPGKRLRHAGSRTGRVSRDVRPGRCVASADPLGGIRAVPRRRPTQPPGGGRVSLGALGGAHVGVCARAHATCSRPFRR